MLTRLTDYVIELLSINVVLTEKHTGTDLDAGIHCQTAPAFLAFYVSPASLYKKNNNKIIIK